MLCESIVSSFTCNGHLCNCHLHYLSLYLNLWKRTMQFSILRALILTGLYCLHCAKLLHCHIYHTFRTRIGIVCFARLLFIPVYSSNGVSCKVCSPSCFLLMGFWNLHSYCCTTSPGRWHFCGGVLLRGSTGSRDIPYIENPYFCHAAIGCVEETLISPENNLILNFVT